MTSLTGDGPVTRFVLWWLNFRFDQRKKSLLLSALSTHFSTVSLPCSTTLISRSLSPLHLTPILLSCRLIFPPATLPGHLYVPPSLSHYLAGLIAPLLNSKQPECHDTRSRTFFTAARCTTVQPSQLAPCPL